MRIGILTGGGDVPGLNPCIKAVVNRVAHEGHEVIGLRRGWAALLEHDPDDPTSAARHFLPLEENTVRTIDRTGGTFLHTSRTNPSRVRAKDVPAHLAHRIDGEGPFDFTDHALRVIESIGIDVLIPIGGDDTLSYGLRMHDEGVPVIAIPKTMDNDVHGTDYCIGFSTAITRRRRVHPQPAHEHRLARADRRDRAVRPLQRRDVADLGLPCRRRPRGHLAKSRSTSTSSAQLLIADKSSNPSNYAMVTVSEGATLAGGEMVLSGEDDAYGHRKLGGIGELTSALIKERTGEDIIYQQLGYLMRSGSPDSLDLMVATNYAVMAADLALEGATGRMVALRSGTYTAVPISATREGVRRVDVDELYDVAHYRPKVRHVAGKPMFLY